MDDLLREAIADAKAVRETALENAKIALEEAFTPRLQSMLSKKIASEMEDKDEEDSEEMRHEEMRDKDEEDSEEMRHEDMHDNDEEMKDSEEMDHEEMRDKEEEMDSEEMRNSEEEMDNDEDAHEHNEEMDKDEEDSEEMAHKDEAAHDKDEEDSEEMREEEDSDEEMEEELDLESVLAELEADLNEEDKDEEDNEEMREADYSDKEGKVGSGDGHMAVKETKTDASSEIGSGDNVLYEPQNDSSEIGAQGPEGKGKDEPAGKELPDHEVVDDLKEAEDKDEEDLDLDEVLAALTEEDKEEEDKEETEKLKKEIKETREVVKFMRAKLNEVNLLNAKLLFSNKLFRAFGLNNDQKLKVVENFDRTKNLREVKLVYATLAESFKKPSKLSESVVKGSSSKPTASTKPAKQEVLSEGTELRNRFKKLANIL